MLLIAVIAAVAIGSTIAVYFFLFVHADIPIYGLILLHEGESMTRYPNIHVKSVSPDQTTVIVEYDTCVGDGGYLKARIGQNLGDGCSYIAKLIDIQDNTATFEIWRLYTNPCFQAN